MSMRSTALQMLSVNESGETERHAARGLLHAVRRHELREHPHSARQLRDQVMIERDADVVKVLEHAARDACQAARPDGDETELTMLQGYQRGLTYPPVPTSVLLSSM